MELLCFCMEFVDQNTFEIRYITTLFPSIFMVHLQTCRSIQFRLVINARVLPETNNAFPAHGTCEAVYGRPLPPDLFPSEGVRTSPSGNSCFP